MGLIIEDGKGTGKTAAVDDENRLKTLAITASLQQHINHTDGLAFTAMFSVTPTGAGDCFGYIKNESDEDMVVTALMMRCASDETIQVKLGDSGTATGGTDITLANRNAGSGNEASVDSQQGVNIIGLSGGVVVAGAFVKGGENSMLVPILSSLIIPKNKVITFYAVTGTAAIMLGASINFHGH